MKVKGKIVPLRNNVIVTDMNFESQTTKSGLFIASDNGKTSGIHPRWGRVFAVGPEQKDIQIGEWVLVEHGRWTRTIEYEISENDTIELRMVEEKSILATSETRPDDIMRA